MNAQWRSAIKIQCMFLLTLLFIGCDILPTKPDDSVSGRSLYVLNALGRTISRISLANGAVEPEFATTPPVPGTLGKYTGHLLILNSTPASLEMLSPDDSTAGKTLTLPPGSNPFDLDVYADRIYVTGLNSGQLYMIDARRFTMLDSAGVGVAPEGIAVDQNHIFVASSDGWQSGYTGSSVHMITRETLAPVDTIPVGTNPQRLVWGTGPTLHVLCTGNYVTATGQVDVINPNTRQVTSTIGLGGFPGYLFITPENLAYASDFGVMTNQDTSGFLYSYNAVDFNTQHTNVNPIRIGYGAMGMAYDDQAHRLYVANFSDNTVQALDPKTGEILDTYEVGDGPQAMVIL